MLKTFLLNYFTNQFILSIDEEEKYCNIKKIELGF